MASAAGIFSLFTNFLSIFILLLHLGCFTFKSTENQPSRKRRVSPLSPSISSSSSQSRFKFQTRAAISYLKRIFSSSVAKHNSDSQSPIPTLTSARSSYQSIVNLVPVEDQPSDVMNIAAASDQFFPLRNDIFPCTLCGEIFQKPQLLETHQSVKHAVSELSDGDSGKNIVFIIFKTGWRCKEKNPVINRILKIHNSQKILTRFEEYREVVKTKAAAAARNGGVRRRDERCIADGNELLRFYCATFMCDLGQNGNSNVCNQQYCSVCGIIKAGFSGKMDGICTMSSSFRAHAAVPEDIEEEFSFMNVKRAMLVCRVVAGRVGSDEDEIIKKEGYDSVLARSDGESGVYGRFDEEELIVFNPRAVLPCFVIVYTV
ncbi:zinc finger (C2H2 type) family protein [Euphorbia peplus]|nr:zinc finger (C2H2 type) family protein [Euphorbia peplus]